MNTIASGRIPALLFAAMALLASPPLVAAIAGAVIVEAVQMPAWVERDGANPVPVQAGMELRNRDRLRTGANARLLLRTPDGSTVKLGESATFRIEDAQQRPGNLFAASMSVLNGAFRFTTNALSRVRGRRDVNLVFPNVTIGIRGTDVWGKSVPDRQVVCLIEGRIDVAPQGEAALVMDQPLQFYVRENNRSLPVGQVDPAQLREWAAETEIAAGQGALRRGGRWKILLASADSQAAALKLYDDIRAAGYPAEIRPVESGEKRVYELMLRNLPSRAEAEALATALKGKMGVVEPKVSM